MFHNAPKERLPLIYLSFVLLTAMLLLLGILYGGRLIAERFTVAQFTYKLHGAKLRESNLAAAGNELVVSNGLHLALLHARMDPTLWRALPQDKGWSQSAGSNEMSLLIVLTNNTKREEMYVRVLLNSTGNALKYHVYRPK